MDISLTYYINIFDFFFYVALICFIIFLIIFSNTIFVKKFFTLTYLFYQFINSIIIFGIHLSFNINVEREFYPDYLEYHELEEISIRTYIISKTYLKTRPLKTSEKLTPDSPILNTWDIPVLKDVNIRNK